MSRWVVVVVSGPPPKMLDPLAAQPVPASALELEPLPEPLSELPLEPPLELLPLELAFPPELALAPELVLPLELPPCEGPPDEVLPLLALPELLTLASVPDDGPASDLALEDEPAEAREPLPEVPPL
jgi:hypothetical protein